MQRIKNRLSAFYKKDPRLFWYLFIIVLIAFLLRVYNYFERIYVYADNALFVQAAYYAWDTLKIPQIGPFAQAPFFTGPWWLWILELLFIFPFGILTPWYFMTLASIGFVLLMYLVGKELRNKSLGLIAALLTAVSTAQIDNSFMTWNAAADSYLGLFAILFLLKYKKTQKPFFLFLIGFCVSLAITIHFQMSLLSPLILVALLVGKPSIKKFLALGIGCLVPMLPLFYFDIRFHWFEIRRIIDYLWIAQYRIYVPNRWLTYAGVFWPETWKWIIGGKMWIGYVLMGTVAFMSLIRLTNFKKHFYYYLIVIPFVLSIILLRYYRGERFFYYTNYAHAYVLLITAWTLFELFKLKKIAGIALFAVVTVFTMQASIENFKRRAITFAQVTTLANEIYQKYPAGSTFSIYECPFQASLLSTPLSYLMYYQGRNTLDGIKIGVCNQNLDLTWKEVTDDEVNREYGYRNKSTEHTYVDMTEWWIKKPPGESLY